MFEEEYKGYKIVGDGTFGMKVIKPLGKGSVPLHLRGLYSNAAIAKKSIDLHINEKKAVKGGETE